MRHLVQTADSPRLLEVDLNSRLLENFNLVAFDSTMQRIGRILYTVIWETISKQKEVYQIKKKHAHPKMKHQDVVSMSPLFIA